MGRLLVTQDSAGHWTANMEAYDTHAGRGTTSKEAIGDFFINNADKLFGVDVEITEYRDPNQFELPVHSG